MRDLEPQTARAGVGSLDPATSRPQVEVEQRPVNATSPVWWPPGAAGRIGVPTRQELTR